MRIAELEVGMLGHVGLRDWGVSMSNDDGDKEEGDDCKPFSSFTFKRNLVGFAINF